MIYDEVNIMIFTSKDGEKYLKEPVAREPVY